MRNQKLTNVGNGNVMHMAGLHMTHLLLNTQKFEQFVVIGR